MQRGFRDTIKTSKGYVLIDSRNTFDHGFETMVFRCDQNGNVSNWLDIDVDRYFSYEEMLEGHVCMINKWRGV